MKRHLNKSWNLKHMEKWDFKITIKKKFTPAVRKATLWSLKTGATHWIRWLAAFMKTIAGTSLKILCFFVTVSGHSWLLQLPGFRNSQRKITGDHCTNTRAGKGITVRHTRERIIFFLLSKVARPICRYTAHPAHLRQLRNRDSVTVYTWNCRYIYVYCLCIIYIGIRRSVADSGPLARI